MTTDLIAQMIIVLLGALMITQAWVCRKITDQWVHPASLFTLYWAFTSITPVLIFDIPIGVFGTLIIFAMSLFFSFGAILSSRDGKSIKMTRPEGLYSSRLLKIALYAVSASSLVMLVINSQIQGIGLDRLFTLDAAAEYSQMRYSGTIVSNIFLQLSTVLAYLSASLGGIIIPDKKVDKRLIILFAMAPVLFVMMTQSAKGAFVLAVALFLGGVIVRLINDTGKFEARIYANMPRIATYAFLALIAISISFLSRGGNIYGNIEDLKFALGRSFLSYSFGHVYSFNDWASGFFGQYSQQYYSDGGYPPGYLTFLSIFNLLGVEYYVPPGTYEEYFQYSDILQTNIYTIYRGLIDDFTIAGAAIFMFVAGCIFGFAFRKMVGATYSPVGTSLFIGFLAFTQQSIYISIFQYNSIYIFIISLAILLAINNSFAQHGRVEA